MNRVEIHLVFYIALSPMLVWFQPHLESESERRSDRSKLPRYKFTGEHFADEPCQVDDSAGGYRLCVCVKRFGPAAAVRLRKCIDARALRIPGSLSARVPGAKQKASLRPQSLRPAVEPDELWTGESNNAVYERPSRQAPNVHEPRLGESASRDG